jgi:predicted MFS family arabinose efflux permease
MRLLRTALGNPQIARLEGAWAATQLGNWAFTILLALLAYDRGGTTAVGVAALVRLLPSGLVASYTAMLADRHSRRAVLLASSLGRAGLLGLTALAAAAGAPLGVVLVLAALFTAVSTAHAPAQAALLPQVARTPDELAAANVCWSSIDYAGFLAGSLAAGALVAATGLPTALGLCALAFLAAAVLVAGMRRDAPPEALPEAQTGAAELMEGFRTVGRHPDLRLLVGVFAAVTFVQGILDVLLVIAAIELLDMGQSGVGWLNSAWGVGGLAGGGAAIALLRRGQLASGIAAGCLLAGLPVLAVGVLASAGAALGLIALAGIGFGMVEVALLTLTQRLAAGDVLGRVYGVKETVNVVASALGALVAAGLVGLVDVDGSLIATGVLLPLLVVALSRRLGALEAGAPVPERPFAVLREVPLFAPLPMAAVETLAVRATAERFEPGQPLITQGDEGDTFYVIDDGTVEVSQDGVVLVRRHEGEFFGEIALLRDAPRMASVEAVTPVGVLVIARDDFLAAIGAHPRSGREAETAVEERLASAAATPVQTR